MKIERMTGEFFEKNSYPCGIHRCDTRLGGCMFTNHGQILTGTSMGYVFNRADGIDGDSDTASGQTYAESLMVYFRDDKGIDAKPGQVSRKRTPKQIEDAWVEMGKSLTKIDKKSVRDYRLLEPGWAGELEDDQVAYIRSALHDDPDLAYKWGFKRSTKRFNDDVIRRVAERGDADHRTVNVHLVKGQV